MREVESVVELCQEFKIILSDAYGVLNDAGGILDRAPAFLRGLNQPLVIVSNDSSSPVDMIAAKYRVNGEELVAVEDIVSSGLVLQTLLRRDPIENAVYLGEEKSLAYLRDGVANIHAIDDMSHDQELDALIVMGCGNPSWRKSLDKSVNLLREQPGCRLLAPNPDRLFYAGQGRVGIAAGALAEMLEGLTGTRAEYFGKPHAPIFEFALQKATSIAGDIEPEEILMIGDNLLTDIAGAQAFGIKTLLVLSGNTDRAQLAASEIQPDFVASGV